MDNIKLDYENDILDDISDISSHNTMEPGTVLLTSAGRGYHGAYQAMLTPIQKANMPQPSNECGITRPLPGIGRAGMIIAMNVRADQKKTKPLTDSDEQIRHHLRQAIGEGHSNALIEEQFRDMAQVNVATAQFQDAESIQVPEDIASDVGTLVPILSKTNLCVGGAKKKKKGKERAFHKYNPDTASVESSPTSEADRSRLPKKTITEIFRERPDYEKSYYNSQKVGPFALASKNDFPALK